MKQQFMTWLWYLQFFKIPNATAVILEENLKLFNILFFPFIWR